MPVNRTKWTGVARRHKVMFATLGALTLVSIGAAVGFVILLSGAMSTAATTQHFALTHRLLEAGLKFSVNTAAADVAVPRLDDPQQLIDGAACFRQHCTQCHGAPGAARGDAAKGMLPIPNSLVESARSWSPAALYTITRRGVRMTGMPAWEYRLSEASLWSTVAFMSAMPRLTTADYDRLGNASGNCEASSELPVDRIPDRDELLRQYACHSCHRIEGVIGPRTHVGPPLIDWSQRKYIAGEIANTEDNLVAFIMAPQQLSPGTLMPDLDVSEAHARQIAAYLMEDR